MWHFQFSPKHHHHHRKLRKNVWNGLFVRIVIMSPIQLSPFRIFCSVCAVFSILYATKYLLFTDSTTLYEEEISFKRLLEASVYLAERGGKVLKDIREKSDLQVWSKFYMLLWSRLAVAQWCTNSSTDFIYYTTRIYLHNNKNSHCEPKLFMQTTISPGDWRV